MESAINNKMPMENSIQENYFDRNITKIIFYVNVFVAIFYVVSILLSIFISSTFPNSSISFLFERINIFVGYFLILVLVTPLVSLSLGIFNYRNKRKAILKGLAYSSIAYLLPLCLLLLMYVAVFGGVK